MLLKNEKMKVKIRSFFIFFFSLFGGILFFKTAYYVWLMNKKIDYSKEIEDNLIISFFVALIIVFFDGYEVLTNIKEIKKQEKN